MRKYYILFLASLFAGYAYSQGSQECLENDIIHRYMNEFSYDTIPDYNVSYVLDYFNEGKTGGYRMDAPKPVSLSWTLDPGAVAQRVEVSEQSDYSNAWVYNARNDTAGYDVYNLIPGKKYYYRVISTDSGSNESVVKEGEFNTSGEIRMILAEGAWNIRDMGGWTSTLTGQPVAYGKIYRGGQLKAKGKDSILLSNEGIEFMRMIGIRAELDLRSNDQVPSSVSALAKKDANDRYDVDFRIIPEAVNARMYHFQNNDANIRELQWIINELKQNKPVFFHCQNGADRTGTLGFLIGALLGVTEGNLAKDYEMTTFCEEAAAAYDPTEAGFARLRNYTGKMGSPLGSSEDNNEYMFAELANTMKSVSPTDGTYHEKIYNFFRNGISGTKISAADLSWFIKEMTGYTVLADMNADVDTLRLGIGDTHQLQVSALPAEAPHSAVTYKTTSSFVATVSNTGKVTVTGPGKAYIIVTVGGEGNKVGLEKYIPVIVPMTESTVPGYTVESDAIDKYMSETHYSSDDYTVSSIENYLSDDKVRRDWPQAVTIKWMAYPGVTSQHLYVSETADFEEYKVDVELGSQDSTYTIEGLSPQQLFYYKVTASLSGSDITTVSSAFRTTGVVKLFNLRKVYNMRDLGGWTGMGGHKVQYGLLYRGSRLRGNTSEGGKPIDTEEAKTILRLGVTAELDLRSDEETSINVSALDRRVSMYARVSNARESQGANVARSDANIVALQQIITWLKNGRKVYIESSLGADRVGTLAFLINGLLGVDEENLCKDYELSSFSGEKSADVLRKRNTGDFPVMVSAIKNLNGATLQEKIYRYFSEGIYGLEGSASISKADLNWFISFMLDCPESEVESSPMTKIEKVVAPKITGKIYNLLGQEVENPGPGIYIMNGKKFIIK